jgi:hypothetical protein
MKTFTTVLLILCTMSCALVGQNTDNYLFSDSIQKQYKACYSSSNRSMCDHACWDLSYIGAHAKVLSTWNINNSGKADNPNPEKLNKSEFKILSAKKIILDSAKSKKVIMLNEAHHLTPHRIFTLDLLLDLKKLGFTHLGVEAIGLHESNSLLTQRGYPTLMSGFYLKDPHFANMIRIAIKLGYKVFRYDTSSGGNIKFREYNQALNIANVIKQDTNARIIVHAGWGHIREDTASHGGVMAYQFKKMTGIDPFTINQASMNEESTPDFENDIYKQFAEIKSPSVLMNKKTNNLYTNIKYDCILFHPRTHYTSNRPSWLYDCEAYIKKKISLKSDLTYPLLVLVYDIRECEETKEPIPIDVVELLQPVKAVDLFFPYKGAYKIIFKEVNKKENVQTVLNLK